MILQRGAFSIVRVSCGRWRRSCGRNGPGGARQSGSVHKKNVRLGFDLEIFVFFAFVESSCVRQARGILNAFRFLCEVTFCGTFLLRRAQDEVGEYVGNGWFGEGGCSGCGRLTSVQGSLGNGENSQGVFTVHRELQE